MTADPDLAAFVRDYVRSVWALELLLLLRRDPARWWAPEALVRELRASTGLVADNLRLFEKGGLAVRDEAGSFRYAPASPVVDAFCGRLEEAYRTKPVTVINLIASQPDQLRSLADAFRFKGDGTEGGK